MIVFGIAGLSVLAGAGVEVMSSWVRHKFKPIVAFAALLPLSLVVLEYWNPPMLLSDLSQQPSVLAEIRDDPSDFTVLDVPWGRVTGVTANGDSTVGTLTDYYQTIYERPSLGGYVSRASDSALDWVGQEPGLRYLALPDAVDSPSGDDANPELVRSVFLKYRIKYVLLHRRDPTGYPLAILEDTLQKLDLYLRDVVGLIPINTNPMFTVYRNPQVQ